jgi:hypothetical protein
MSHIDEGLLHAFIDGAIRPGDDGHAALTEHLAYCGDCRARLDEAREIRQRALDVLGSIRPRTVVSGDYEDVLRRARIAASGVPVHGSAGADRASVERGAGAPARPRRPRRLITMAWAASLTVAVGAGWMARATLGDADVAPAGTAAAAADGPAGGGAAATDDAGYSAEPAASAPVAEVPRGADVDVSGQAAAGVRQAAAAQAGRGEAADVVVAAAAAAPTPVPARESDRAGEPDVAALDSLPSVLSAEALALRRPVVTGFAAEPEQPRVASLLEPIIVTGAATPRPQSVQQQSENLVTSRLSTSDVARGGAALPPAATPPVSTPPVPLSPPSGAPVSGAAREGSTTSPRPTAPERLVPEAAGVRPGLRSRLFGTARAAEGGRTRWRTTSLRDVERRQRHELAHVPALAITGAWHTDEAGIITMRLEQRTESGIVLELVQWHDPVTSRLRSAEPDGAYAAVVRTTERPDGTGIVFADLPDGTHVTLTALLPLDELIRLVGSLRPLAERR